MARSRPAARSPRYSVSVLLSIVCLHGIRIAAHDLAHRDRGVRAAGEVECAADVRAVVVEAAVDFDVGDRRAVGAAAFPPGDAKENWAILRALSPLAGEPLPYDSLAALRRDLVKAAPHLGAIDTVPENEWRPLELGATNADAAFVNVVKDYYLTNPIARASQLMAELSAQAKARKAPAMAAE